MSEWQETRHSPPGIRDKGGWVLVGRTRDSWMCMVGGGGIEPKNPIVETVNTRC